MQDSRTGKGEDMRPRASRRGPAVIMVAMLVVLAMVLALAGCGSGNEAESKAKEYIENAESTGMTQYSPEEMETKSREVFTAIGTAAQTNAALDQAEIEAAEELLSVVEELNSSMKEARKEYEKVKSLEGVEKYKEYVDLQIKSMEIMSMQPMIEVLEYAVDNMATSDYDGQELMSRLTAMLDALSKEEAEAQDIEKKIDELRSELGL